MKKKVCIVTGSRAEYDLLYLLMKEIEATNDLELQIIATGMHLSPEFGLTYRQIEKDGFTINYKVEMLLSSDTESGISKSIGLGLIGFGDVFSQMQPDLLLVLGDRLEIFSAVSAAMINKIPVTHLHGGEVTEGVIDEPIRHSITKMSHIHLTATESYRNRVIQLGEQPESVFNVGALGVDNVMRLHPLSRDEFQDSIRFKLGKHNLLVTFHPVTLENATAETQFKNLLQALEELDETHFIFTKSNADTGGRIINEMIEEYVAGHPEKAVVRTSLGRLRYLSGLQYMDGVVGNSSSGLLEAPSFKIGTLNIGDRQRGRAKANSVIDCEPTTEDIRHALEKLFSQPFKEDLKNTINPYGKGGATEKILKIIRSYPLEGIIKKKFYDLKVP